jgi:hypothetical protein
MVGVRSAVTLGSQKEQDKGTIRRKGLETVVSRNPQRLDVQVRLMHLETQWIVGFVDGEGCFHVSVHPHAGMATGYQVLPEFTVVQHRRDVQVLYGLKAYFGCGVVRVNQGDRMAYRVRGLEHLAQRIVPFFLKHPLKTSKNIDFLKFRDVVLLCQAGEHLTEAGIIKIQRIAAQMNRSRTR